MDMVCTSFLIHESKEGYNNMILDVGEGARGAVVDLERSRGGEELTETL